MSERAPHWSGGPWLAVPYPVYEQAARAKLSRGELLTLLGLYRHTGFHHGEVCMGVHGLSEETGLNMRTVERGLARLRTLGFVELVKQGIGRKNANEYRMKNPGTSAVVCPRQAPAGDNGNPGVPTGVYASETPAAPSRNPGGAVQKPRSPDRTNKESTDREQSSSSRAAAAVRDELRRNGIRNLHNAGLAELVNSSYVTAALVRSVAGQMKPGEGTGLMIERLKDAVSGEIARSADQRQRAEARSRIESERHEAEQERVRREAEDREQKRQERERRAAVWTSLSRRDVERLTAEIVKDLETRGERQTARDYRAANPAHWVSLKNAIIDRAEQERQRAGG